MNNWNQQPGNNHYAENNGIPHSGSLLRDYRQQQGQQVQQFSPASQGQQMSPRTGLLSSQWAQEPVSPPMPQPGGEGSQGWVSNTIQMVRGWSGKMAAMTGYRNQTPPPPEPLVLYHP